MRTSTVAALLLSVSTVTMASGCGSTHGDPAVTPVPVPSSSTPPPTTTPPMGPSAIHGVFQFLAEKNGGRSEVTRIVYTDRVVVRLEGLPPGAEVVISATMYTPQARGRGYVSQATFLADDHGVIESDRQTATGTYTGIDADGFFWSGLAGDVPEGRGADRQAVYFDAHIADASIAKGVLGRSFMADGVKVESVVDDGLVAKYFLPAGGGGDRVPVVAFGGSEGGISGGELFAARAASEGHPALAIAYFGAKGVPADLYEVPLEYFAKAFAWLDRRPELRKGKVVVMGGSRGGELALQLGATFPGVIGVIAETPSSYRWASLAGDNAAWTFEGKPLAYVPSTSAGFPPTVSGPGGALAYVLRGEFESSLAKATAADLDAARIHVEDTRGPILMLAGDDDKMWPACDFVERAMNELRQSGHVAQHHDEGICFPDTGHAVGSVGLPTSDSMWASLGDGTLFALGGTPGGNARAGRQSAEKIRAFLDRVTK